MDAAVAAGSHLVADVADVVPEAVTVFEQENRLVLQFPHRDPRLTGERMVRRHCHQEAVVEDHGVFETRVAHGQGEQAQVDVGGRQRGGHLLGPQFAQMHLRLGVALPHRGQHPRQEIGRHSRDGRHPQRPDQRRGGPMCRAHQLIGVAQDRPRPLRELVPDRGHGDSPAHSFHHHYAEVLLELAHLHADGGLGHEAGRCSLSDVLVGVDRNQVLELPDGRAHP